MNVTRPLDSDVAQLAEFYSRLIAESGAELTPASAVPPSEARRMRRVERQRASRLVRVLSTARRTAPAGSGSAVAA